ncbi:hypothetical protein AB4212_19040, partial [Streptomyces sp. 2MCAF27]
ALGRDEALLLAEGRRLRLGPRHSEIMVLLAAHPEGLSGDRLALELYGEQADRRSPVTLRAELSRLRRLVGPLLGSRPYRLCAPYGLTADGRPYSSAPPGADETRNAFVQRSGL